MSVMVTLAELTAPRRKLAKELPHLPRFVLPALGWLVWALLNE